MKKTNKTRWERIRNTSIFASVFMLVPYVTHALGEDIGEAILTFTSFLTGAAGYLLNLTIVELVVGMGDSYAQLDATVTTLWAVIRDICNILFIFGLIFIALQTILNIEKVSTKKTLVAIIVGALLINFSLFATKIVIDVSNLVAIEIFQTISLPEEQDSLNYGVAGIFMQATGLSGFYSNDTGVGLKNTKTASGGFTFFLMGMIFLVIAAFAFAAGAIYLIVRFVGLILLMIFSPIMFAGFVFPQTAKVASDLISRFLSLAFLAPVYLFMLYIAAQILEQTSKMYKGNINEAFDNAKIESFSIVLNFVIAIILLMGAVTIARSLSNKGSALATKFATRAAGAAVIGGAAIAGRNTIGAAAYSISQSDSLKEKAKDSVGAKLLLRGAQGASSASFDARNTADFGKTAGLGIGKKGGYVRKVKEIDKKETAFAQSLGTVGDDDFDVAYSKKSMETQKETVEKLKKDKTVPKEKVVEAQERYREAEKTYRMEQNRRQAGSNISNQLKITSRRNEIIRLDSEIKTTTDTNKLKALEERKQKLKAENKQLEKQKQPSRGYAGQLEETGLRGVATALVTGRIPWTNQRAGANLRKTYEKNMNRSKEEINTDRILGKLDATRPKDN